MREIMPPANQPTSVWPAVAERERFILLVPNGYNEVTGDPAPTAFRPKAGREPWAPGTGNRIFATRADGVNFRVGQSSYPQRTTMDPSIVENMIVQGRDSYEARLASGQARLKRRELDQSVEDLKRAWELSPGHSMAWQELGRAGLESGDHDGARAAWIQASAVAEANGDKQAEKVMAVWLRRLK